MTEIHVVADIDHSPPPTGPVTARSREPLWRQMAGQALRQRRSARGQTLGQVAARAGVSPQYLSEIERGLKDPSSEIIAAVSGALGTSLLDLTADVARSLSASRTPCAQAAPARLSCALAA
ncbi:helix-turn-helix domain-containing protein [Brevibacterium luteolum]|uniref:helix-turn-helix domain-containing protein n=1 Tax=Brevibacterium luteolum TaxID=199591 RepID=UPI0038790C19